MLTNLKVTGFSLIEVLLALGILSLVVFTGATALINSFELNRLSGESSAALLYSQEGIEATRSIANQDWSNLTAGTYGLTSSNAWSFSGTNDTYGTYTRTILVESVARDEAGNITTTGGTTDPDTFKITSTVSWTFNSLRDNLISLVTYLTNWDKAINSSSGNCDWSGLAFAGTYDKAGTSNSNGITLADGYAYLVTDDQSGANVELFILDISTPTSPTLVGSLEISSNVQAVAVSGNYAYLATSDNSAELQVIDITDKATPSLVGSLDLGANQDATDIAAQDNYVYLTKLAGATTNRELYIVDVLTPITPTEVGSYEVGSDVFSLDVYGTYAYLATGDNPAELQVIDITNKAMPTLAGTYDAPGNADGQAVVVNGSTIFLGRANSAEAELLILDATTPSSITAVGSYEVGSEVVALAYNSETVLAATRVTNEELLAIDVSTLSTPSLLTSLDLNADSFDLEADDETCSLYVANTANSAELVVIQNMTPSPTPTPPPYSTCSQFCSGNGYASGTCRQNTQQCTHNSETHESSGDVYCTGGANADTCCCQS